jgi:hypothetical protein
MNEKTEWNQLDYLHLVENIKDGDLQKKRKRVITAYMKLFCEYLTSFESHTSDRTSNTTKFHELSSPLAAKTSESDISICNAAMPQMGAHKDVMPQCNEIKVEMEITIARYLVRFPQSYLCCSLHSNIISLSLLSLTVFSCLVNDILFYTLNKSNMSFCSYWEIKIASHLYSPQEEN